MREALSALQTQGYEIELVAVDSTGKLDLEQLRQKLREDTILLTLPAVDSELGVVQPLGQVTEILKNNPHCHLHVDATQAVGKQELMLEGVDTMSMAPHKFGGLTGSGLLYQRKSTGSPASGPRGRGRPLSPGRDTCPGPGGFGGKGPVHSPGAPAGADRLCPDSEPPAEGGPGTIPQG